MPMNEEQLAEYIRSMEKSAKETAENTRSIVEVLERLQESLLGNRTR